LAHDIRGENLAENRAFFFSCAQIKRTVPLASLQSLVEIQSRTLAQRLSTKRQSQLRAAINSVCSKARFVVCTVGWA